MYLGEIEGLGWICTKYILYLCEILKKKKKIKNLKKPLQKLRMFGLRVLSLPLACFHLCSHNIPQGPLRLAQDHGPLLPQNY